MRGGLVAHEVHVDLGRRSVLRGVSVHVRHGQVLALVGPNGAGKSTLLRTLAGDLRPARGEVTLDGVALADWPARRLATRRAVLTQSPTVGAAFTVQDVVRLGRHPHRTRAHLDDRVVRESLEAVGMLDRASSRWSRLSGGEQQRVALARVLAQIHGGERCIVLLDEPTSALDLAWQQRALGLARRAARRGHAVVAVLHDLALAAVHADRVLLLHDGRTHSIGTPDRVLTPEALERAYAVRTRWVHVPGLGSVPVVIDANPPQTPLEVQ